MEPEALDDRQEPKVALRPHAGKRQRLHRAGEFARFEIEHLLSGESGKPPQPLSPQTNGMIERFNGRVAEVVKTTVFHRSQELRDTLLRYVKIYNQQIPQKALGHVPPVQALKKWQAKRPDLSSKKLVYIVIRNIPCNVYGPPCIVTVYPPVDSPRPCPPMAPCSTPCIVTVYPLSIHPILMGFVPLPILQPIVFP